LGAGVRAADPVLLPERGKADTRSGKSTGSTACEAAPELVFGGPKTSHGASIINQIQRHQPRVDGQDRERQPALDAVNPQQELNNATEPRGFDGLTPPPDLDSVQAACAVRVSRRRRERAQARPIERWIRRHFRPAYLPFRGPEKPPDATPATTGSP
jgi:hypothetical protein